MLVLIALLLSQSGSTPPPAPVFADAAIGAPATLLLESLGEPVVRRRNDAGGNEYVYIAPGNALEFVEVQGGNVTSVELGDAPWDDPLSGPPIVALGVSLRDRATKLTAIASDRLVGRAQSGNATLGTFHGYDGLDYTFTEQRGEITRIAARLPIIVEQTLPPGTEPILHGGSSFADAIVLKSSLESLGVRAEYAYLSAHPCGAKGCWHKAVQAMVTRNDVAYDVLSAVCTQGSARRDFYFDITGYFGKFH